MSEEPRKRSRFDQVEPEPKKSRFDRRSRSPAPARQDSESRRSRSPVTQSIERPGSSDKKEAAAAAAARINAELQARKGIQHVDVPAVPATNSPSAGAGAAASPSQPADLQKEIYQQDGDYIKDIEVNDLRNRYTLTKGNTQKMIKEKTGADVTTRGSYYPDKSMATAANPPLYLHVTSTSKEGLEKAVKEIEELMTHELPNLIDERRFRRREPEQVERDHLGRRKWPEERIPIDLEPIPGFNLRAQVVGQGGAYVKYIQSETTCRVQIKGRGSGFMEHDTGAESDEQMYLHVASPDAAAVERAAQQCRELLESVRTNYEAFKERPPRSAGPDRGSYGGGYQGRDRGDSYQERDRNGSGSYGGSSAYDPSAQYGYGGQPAYGAPGAAQSPTTATPMVAADPTQQQQIDAWVQYYAANPDQDPYAQYGGYGAMMQMYAAQGMNMNGQPMAAGYAGSPAQNGGGYGAPPPPPPPGQSEPPPPPPGGDAYNQVPPPPGM